MDNEGQLQNLQQRIRQLELELSTQNEALKKAIQASLDAKNEEKSRSNNLMARTKKELDAERSKNAKLKERAKKAEQENFNLKRQFLSNLATSSFSGDCDTSLSDRVPRKRRRQDLDGNASTEDGQQRSGAAAGGQSFNLQSQLDAAKREILELKTKFVQSNEARKFADAKFVKEQENAKKLSEQNGALKEKITSLKKEHGNLKTEIKETRQFFDAKLVEFKEKANEANVKVSDLQKELDAEKQNNVETTEKVTTLTTQLDITNQQLTNSSRDLDKEREKVEELNKQIKDDVDRRNELVKDLWNQAFTECLNKHYEDALELYLRAIGIEESRRKDAYELNCLWRRISKCYEGLERFEPALQAITTTIGYKNTCSLDFYNRGMIYKKMNKKTEAIANFKKAIELDPNYQAAKNELAELEKGKGK